MAKGRIVLHGVEPQRPIPHGQKHLRLRVGKPRRQRVGKAEAKVGEGAQPKPTPRLLRAEVAPTPLDEVSAVEHQHGVVIYERLELSENPNWMHRRLIHSQRFHRLELRLPAGCELSRPTREILPGLASRSLCHLADGGAYVSQNSHGHPAVASQLVGIRVYLYQPGLGVEVGRHAIAVTMVQALAQQEHRIGLAEVAGGVIQGGVGVAETEGMTVSNNPARLLHGEDGQSGGLCELR